MSESSYISHCQIQGGKQMPAALTEKASTSFSDSTLSAGNN